MLSGKKIKINITALAAGAFFLAAVVSALPILYCGWFNYATGDDLGKAYQAHLALKHGGGVTAALAAALAAAKAMWSSWEGTWASNFVLAMEPSVFGEKAYRITVPLAFFYIIAGTLYFLHEILVNACKAKKEIFVLISSVLLLLMIQYMPYIRGGMFWYTGMGHYTMPWFFLLLIITWMHKWLRTGRWGYFAVVCLFSVYLSGSHYQHILTALLVIFMLIFMSVLKNGKEASASASFPTEKAGVKTAAGTFGHASVLLLFLPAAILVAGLALCVASPGNAVRGGEGFGLTAGKLAAAVAGCISVSVSDMKTYIVKAPLIVPFFIFCAAAGWENVRAAGGGKKKMPDGAESDECLSRDKADAGVKTGPQTGVGEYGRSGITCRHPLLASAYLFLLYCSANAPAVFAGDNEAGISGGYYDISYFMFLVCLLLLFYYDGGAAALLTGKNDAALRLGKGSGAEEKRLTHSAVAGASLLLCLCALFAVKPLVKNSWGYVSLDFIRSGRLADFESQMEERLEILCDDSVADAVVPEMNDQQGPFMHMQLTGDPDAYTNNVTRLFYEKNTVIALPREEYEDIRSGQLEEK